MPDSGTLTGVLMPQQARVIRSRGYKSSGPVDILLIHSWIPDLEALRSAVPLADVIKAQSVIQGELPIRLERILGVQRPLMELEVVGGERTHLLVVGGTTEQEVGHHVAGTVRTPA